jgi:hypothetical protein
MMISFRLFRVPWPLLPRPPGQYTSHCNRCARAQGYACDCKQDAARTAAVRSRRRISVLRMKTAGGDLSPAAGSACYGEGKDDRAVACLAAYLGRARHRCDITPGGKCDRLRVQRFAHRFPASFMIVIGLGTRTRLRRRGGVRLGVMGFRYTPRKASQFAHGCRSLCWSARSGVVAAGKGGLYVVRLCRGTRRSIAPHECNVRSQKKELGCRAQKGDRVRMRQGSGHSPSAL